ncbi:hypothetical protein JJQ59_34495 (plasmid) [Cupriavidus necator]|uniref:Uncharacterized protein n=1 Tax=Cupriavidus necator TaxID=106590 RepID=A0A367PQ08_CUPNE|nr:hypothetical protein [Cupriavidus necator]QQX89653.1 hypothetical protein JJQ59_34495 [Cupriavidus necator]RCJ09015.1 hypothetical protein DDK22_07800 [Cupriavidus necator]
MTLDYPILCWALMLQPNCITCSSTASVSEAPLRAAQSSGAPAGRYRFSQRPQVVVDRARWQDRYRTQYQFACHAEVRYVATAWIGRQVAAGLAGIHSAQAAPTLAAALYSDNLRRD